MYEALKPYDHCSYWRRFDAEMPTARQLLRELERWIDPPPPPEQVADSCIVGMVPNSLQYTPETWRVTRAKSGGSGGWILEGLEIDQMRPRLYPGQTVWRLRDGSLRVSGIPPELRKLAAAEVEADAMLSEYGRPSRRC